nr:MAG TPA: outer capsid protein sigma-1 attachment protein [Caudoviricetes sp.]
MSRRKRGDLMAADGSIVIKADVDDKQAQNELNRLTKKIDSLNEKISDKKQQAMPLVEQSRQIAANLDEAKSKLSQMKSGNEFFTSSAIKDQEQTVATLQKEWNGVQKRVEAVDASIAKDTRSLERMSNRAGELSAQIAGTSKSSTALAAASKKADKYMDRFSRRVKGLVRRVFVFGLIVQGLRSVREWLGKAVKTNDQATKAISRLKGALLTLAQPFVNVLLPAFTSFVNLLTQFVTAMAKITAVLFGSTIDQTKKEAENLYKESDALNETGESAKKAGKALASFDEINKLNGGNKEKTEPDFNFSENENWLDKMLGSAAEKVASALILAGIAFIAIGASVGSIKMVITGLLLIGAGLFVAEETGVLQSWVDTLGLNNVAEFIVTAVILAGIAMVAIGAATGNILLVIAGLLLIGLAVLYAKNSGMMDDWAETLGLNRAASFITAALLIAGFALIAIGAATGNILMVVAGIALIAIGIYVGVKSGTFTDWASALKLDSAFGYVTAAMQIAGIAMIAIGAAMGNIAIVLAGAALLGFGIAAEVIGQERLEAWWEKLKLTSVAQWISVALLLGGIALVAFAAATANPILLAVGLGILGMGITAAINEGHLKNWVETLGLNKVVGWVSVALMLAGIALIAFGAMTMNIFMLLAGAALLVSGFAIDTTTNKFQSWVETLHLNEVSGWVSTAMLLLGIALVAIGAMTLNVPMLLAGAALLGVGIAAKAGGFNSTKSVSGGNPAARSAMPAISPASVPRLATGAVIPPNREFLAVLGDQKQGNNIEAPESAIEAAVARGMAQYGGGNQTAILKIGEQELGRIIFKLNKDQTQRVGIKVT